MNQGVLHIIACAFGTAAGGAALWLLSRATRAITGNTPKKALLPMLLNVALVFAALLAAALFARDLLLWVAGGLCGGMLLGAAGCMILYGVRARRKKKGAEE